MCVFVTLAEYRFVGSVFRIGREIRIGVELLGYIPREVQLLLVGPDD